MRLGHESLSKAISGIAAAARSLSLSAKYD